MSALEKLSALQDKVVSAASLRLTYAQQELSTVQAGPLFWEPVDAARTRATGRRVSSPAEWHEENVLLVRSVWRTLNSRRRPFNSHPRRRFGRWSE